MISDHVPSNNFPAEWREIQLVRAVEGCVNGIWGDEPTGGDDDLVVLRVADFDRSSFRISLEKLTLRKVNAAERRQRSLSPGDLLIEKSGGGERQLVGQVVLFDHDFPAVTSNFVARMRVRSSFDERYLTYVFSHLYSSRVNLCSIKQNTGIQNLDSSQYLREHFRFPMRSTQVSLAGLLDVETARIDTLIAKQKKLIELLKEKRQAVISQAVTKGLDPDVPMKDSGVEWLGEVPAHWTPSRIKFVISKIADGPHFSPSYVDEGVPMLSARNVRVDGWELDSAKYISEDDAAVFDQRITPRRGDVLLTKGGTTGVAKAVDLDFRFQVWVHIAVLRIVPQRCIPAYLALALNSNGCYAQSQLFTRGATNNDLGLTRIPNIWFALPSLDEQKSIVSVLESVLAKFDICVERAAELITLLQERRTALITAAVTGQIDVSNYKLATEPAAAPATEPAAA